MWWYHHIHICIYTAVCITQFISQLHEKKKKRADQTTPPGNGCVAADQPGKGRWATSLSRLTAAELFLIETVDWCLCTFNTTWERNFWNCAIVMPCTKKSRAKKNREYVLECCYCCTAATSFMFRTVPISCLCVARTITICYIWVIHIIHPYTN